MALHICLITFIMTPMIFNLEFVSHYLFNISGRKFVLWKIIKRLYFKIKTLWNKDELIFRPVEKAV